MGTGILVNMTNGGEGISNISNETRQKMSSMKLGKKSSEETKKRLSVIQTGSGNGFYNKKHNENTKNLISMANSGKVKSEECKMKISIKLKGRIFSDETKSKISISKKGVNHHYCKFEESDIISIRKEYSDGKISQYKLAQKYNVKRGTIYDIIKHITWKHI